MSMESGGFGFNFPLLRELMGHPAVVEPVFVAAPHSVAPVAAVARERRLREPRALVREEIRADLVAHRRPARRARHQAALAAHVPLRARLSPQAYVARLDGQEARARRHPVALYLLIPISNACICGRHEGAREPLRRQARPRTHGWRGKHGLKEDSRRQSCAIRYTVIRSIAGVVQW